MKAVTDYKKSILYSIGFLFLVVQLSAQDTAAVRALLQQKDYARAKHAADKLVGENKTAENYFLQAIVYNTIAKSADASTLVVDAKLISFNALKKSAAIKKEYLFLQGQELARDLQASFVNEGLANFNAAAERNNKAGYESALLIFKHAAQVNEFIYQLAWDSTALQPSLVVLLTKSAVYAEKEADAVYYSKIIVDYRVAKVSPQADYEIAYKWLVFYYGKRNEAEGFNKYLALAKAAYPDNQYFLLAEIDWLRQQKDYLTLFEKYQQLMTADSGNLQYKLAYAGDVFNCLWPTNNGAANVSAQSLVTILKPLAVNKQTAIKANLLLAKTYTNLAQDILKAAGNKLDQKSKSTYRFYMELSNKYLQQITSIKENTNKPEWKEAKQLMASNKRVLTAAKGR